ncbi:MAG: ribonuclease D [Micavibrio sp.]|nr:ribonuclease D [Micavibrio sp.]HCK32522.1 ribonuclease D [Rhodospirillaceae bacterium]|tara:strand:- start:270 stop:884 length:615 start_codon:yes stop_codon:yes gene_type:complete
MTIKLYKNDIPADLDLGDMVAVDTEAMGLNNHRDRLCVVQLSSGDGKAHLVQFERDNDYAAPNLRKLLSDPNVLKIFHFARFDVAIIQKYMGIDCAPVYCTKIASKLVRTFTDRHGLKELCKEFLSIDLSKQQQSSDWGAETLSSDQKKYAASDVLYLHELKEKLDKMLEREGRMDLAQSCFNFLPTRARLDLNGWSDPDIFQH